MIYDNREARRWYDAYTNLGRAAVYWNALEPEEKRQFEAFSDELHYNRGEDLMQAGSPANRVMLIRNGFAKVIHYYAPGPGHIASIIGPGNLVGEYEAMIDRPRHGTVTALNTVTVWAMTVAAFNKFIDRHRNAHRALTESVVIKSTELGRMPVSLALLPAVQRVAMLLFELHNRYGRSSTRSAPLQVPLTQDEIANWMGCSRQTVNHALAELVAEGIIESGHPITVRDENLLRDRAFQEPRRRSARN